MNTRVEHIYARPYLDDRRIAEGLRFHTCETVEARLRELYKRREVSQEYKMLGGDHE